MGRSELWRRWVRRRWLWWLRRCWLRRSAADAAAALMRNAVLALVLVATSAARADNIVLESYTGERPADAPRLLAPVLEELALKKFTAGDGVARLFEAQVSHAAMQHKGWPPDF